jgi:hypothetical protein
LQPKISNRQTLPPFGMVGIRCKRRVNTSTDFSYCPAMP